VAGLAFVLRYIAGLGSGVRMRPPVLIGLGLTVALLTALAPMLAGAPVLATTKLALDLPVLGHVETQTSLFLDVGVYLLIVGVVLDLLRSLGAGIERDMREAR
jgi:multicomponent Na+:H+ antiporter subunit B